MNLNIKEYNKIIDECREIAKKKNADYGCDTLKAFGIKGVVVRMNDKMERLKHLTWKNKDIKVKSESIEDTAQDLINYTIYLILINRGALENGQNK